jgi:hypothetical protein
MIDVRTSPVPTTGEVANVLDEVKNQWSLGNDGQANHLLDALTAAVYSTAGEFAGTRFLGTHLENLANLMNAGGGVDFDTEIDEMIQVLRHGLT